VAAEPNESLDYGGNWRASTYIHGSPGEADPDPPDTVLLNEIMAHTDFADPAYPEYDSNDWIEIYNPTVSPVILDGDWYLSDDLDNLAKWSISPATTVSPLGRISFDEVSDFHHPIDQGFGLDKAGESVFLSYLPGTIEDRVVDCIGFQGQEGGVSLGRCPDGDRYWYPMDPSRGATNVSKIQDVVINEFMFHPPEDPIENTALEYIKLHNPTAADINLWNPDIPNGAWRITGGVDYVFPPGTTILPNSSLLVLSFDPEDPAAMAEFTSAYELESITCTVVGPYTGNLSNKGECISLERPQASDDPAAPDDISWVIVDEVIYFDRDPWTTYADGTGLSLVRAPGDRSGNDPENWSAFTPSPGSDLWLAVEMWRMY
jgi:hypothetical protein